MDHTKKYILPWIVLVSAVSLVVVFRSFFLANFIEPVAYLFWAVWRIISSVNQSFYWALIIVFCLILVIRLVPRENDSTPHKTYTYEYRSPNAVEYWQTAIEDATLGRSEAEHLRAQLKQLAESVIEQGGRSQLAESDDVAAIGTVPLSVAATRFLFPSRAESEASYRNGRLELLSFAPRWLRRWARRFVRQDTRVINEILQWMENEMEINHDR